MMKKLLLIIVCLACGLSLISAAGQSAYGDKKAKDALEKHINIVKTKYPQKYQEMVEKANGPIKDCLSCHADIFEKKNKSRKSRRR
jgi:cytochrome c553